MKRDFPDIKRDTVFVWGKIYQEDASVSHTGVLS